MYAVYVYAVGADRPGPCARIHSKMERTRPRSPLRPAMERTVVATWALGGEEGEAGASGSIGFDELVEDVVDEAPVGAAAEVLERLVELARAQAAELAGTNVGEEGGGVARESLAGDGAGAEETSARRRVGLTVARGNNLAAAAAAARGAGSEGGARQATSADRRRSRRQRAGVAASRAPRAPVDAAPVPLPLHPSPLIARPRAARDAAGPDDGAACAADADHPNDIANLTPVKQRACAIYRPVPLDRASRPRASAVARVSVPLSDSPPSTVDVRTAAGALGRPAACTHAGVSLAISRGKCSGRMPPSGCGERLARRDTAAGALESPPDVGLIVSSASRAHRIPSSVSTSRSRAALLITTPNRRLTYRSTPPWASP